MAGRPKAIVLCAAAAALALGTPAYAAVDEHGGHGGNGHKKHSEQGKAGDHAKPDKGARGGAGDPGGNNGTVKVDGLPYDDGHGNEPHVGCVFRLKFYGFDADQHADIRFDAHAPSGSGLLQEDKNVLISDDAAGGGKDLDALIEYDASTWDLSSLTAHPKQGYHVKLSVDVLEAPGGAKHKVFWIKCAPEAPVTTPGTGTTGGSGTGTTGGSGTGTTGGSATGTTSGSTGTTVTVQGTTTGSSAGTVVTSKTGTSVAGTGVKVLGEKLTRPAATDTAARSSNLPFTGSPAMRMVLLALALLAAGGLLLWVISYAARRSSRAV
jgi:hypothetical protein